MTVVSLLICFTMFFLLFNLVTSDKPSKIEGCWDGQPLPVFLIFFIYIFMSFYCLFLNKGWHYSCLNSSNTVLHVVSYSAMAEWLGPSRWCYTFPRQWQHCLFPITVHSDGMGSDHISNSDLYGPSSSFCSLTHSLSLSLSLSLSSLSLSPLSLSLSLSLSLPTPPPFTIPSLYL